MKKNFKLLRYFLGIIHRSSKRLIPISVLLAVVQGLSPLVNIILPKWIIDELLGAKNIQTLILLIAALGIANFALRFLVNLLIRYKNIEVWKVTLNSSERLAEKCIQLPYEEIEKKSTLDLKERAYAGMYRYQELIEQISVTARSIITLVSLVILLFTFNGWVVIILTGMTLLNILFYKRISDIRYQDSVATVHENRAFGYFGSLAYDFSFGQDIRLAHCAAFLQTKAGKFLNRILEIYGKQYTEIGKLQGFAGINMHLQSFLVYGWIAWKALKGLLSIGDFTMYGNASRQFTQSLTALVDSLIAINGLCLHIEPYLEFDSLPDAAQAASDLLPDYDLQKDSLTIRFDHVWFRYPSGDQDALQDISIEIHPHEKLSIVGTNGAGKTTFIKLLCRLYQPTQGSITINGIDINQIPVEVYIPLLAVVFQDFQLLGYDLSSNIAASPQPDVENLNRVTKFFNIDQMLESLPNGLDTYVNRIFDKDGVTFSGGQMQKIAIARALYKNAPIAILDEPTSALDPRSEQDVYLHFHQLVQGKTAIYISHRLSSTSFTDRIAVFQDGKIVELGKHDALITNNGLYSEMYTKQAKYYQN